MKNYLKFGWIVMIFLGMGLAFLPVAMTQYTWVGTLMPILIAVPTIYLAWVNKVADFGKVFLLMGMFAFFIETVGLLTGYPYGQFSYLEIAGWKIAGILPVSLPFAWVPLSLAAYSVAKQWAGKTLWCRVLIGMATLLLFDLLIDPSAVQFGLWKYIDTNGFFGVPWSNFLGWILSGSVAMLIMNRLFGDEASGETHLALRMSAKYMIGFWLGYWSMNWLYKYPLWENISNMPYLLPSLFGIIALILLQWLPINPSLLKSKK